MHTHAHPEVTALVEYTGTLVHAAEARTAIHPGDGLTVPVLCLDIELDGGMHNRMHVEQPFPFGHFMQAEAAAHRLKKGMRVTVQTPLQAIKLFALACAHIHTHHDHSESEPCQPSTSR